VGAANAILYPQNSVRSWYVSNQPTSGTFVIVDNSAGVVRLSIDTAGHAIFANALTCSGNFNTNQINGTAIIASANIQCNPGSGAAWYYALCPGVRQWLWGANTDGGFYILDNSAGATRLRIDTGGAVRRRQHQHRVHHQQRRQHSSAPLLQRDRCTAINAEQQHRHGRRRSLTRSSPPAARSLATGSPATAASIRWSAR
jgi:hypothetical protein